MIPLKSFGRRKSSRKNLLFIELLLLFSFVIGCGAMGLKSRIDKSAVKIEKIVQQLNDWINDQETREIGTKLYDDNIRNSRSKIIHIQDRIKMRISTLSQKSKDEINEYYRDKFNNLYIQLRTKYPVAMEQLQLE